VLGAGTVLVGTWLVGAMHGRDRPVEAAFTAHVEGRIFNGVHGAMPGLEATDDYWVVGHSDLVLGEGARACRWLANRPLAPQVDPSHGWEGRYTVFTLEQRYLQDTRGLPAITPDARSVVVTQAWTDLCRAVRTAHTAPPALHDD
jgi:hypothetical protein